MTKRLADETALVVSASIPKDEADRLYKNARQCQWFSPVVNSLKKSAGLGERCMYCSGSESSDVEHFRPKATYPNLAFTWLNYLWICTICNRAKLDQFPCLTTGEPVLINPINENVWSYFYIDAFGLLTPTWDTTANDFNYRAKETSRIIHLDRQALQDARKSRMKDLKEKVKDTTILLKDGKLTKEQVQRRINKWRRQPFQPDVADYFLNGPGKSEKPFRELFALIN